VAHAVIEEAVVHVGCVAVAAALSDIWPSERWKIGTIASELGLHHDTVSRAIDSNRFCRGVVRTRSWLL
jgi:hypothetical protein